MRGATIPPSAGQAITVTDFASYGMVVNDVAQGIHPLARERPPFGKQSPCPPRPPGDNQLLVAAYSQPPSPGVAAR